LVVPAGTYVTVRVDQHLSSDHNQPGDTFNGTLVQPIIVNGFVVARRGQMLGGRVAEATKAGRTSGQSRLGVELTELGLVDGQQLPIRTQLMEYSGGSSKGRDAAAIGTTTGAGAAIGAAAAGGVGAAAGAGAGAVASTIGVLLTRGRATEIFPESTLTFRTVEPVTIYTERSAQAFQPVQQGDYPAQSQLQTRPRVQPRYGVYAPYPYPYPYYAPYPYYGYGPRVSIFYGGRFGRRW